MGKTTGNKRTALVILIAFLLVGLGLGVGWYLSDQKNHKNTYPLLDPSVSNPNVKQAIVNFDPLRQDVKNYLGSLGLSHSFYFEYLPNGVSIRDGSDSEAVAASLLKTPVVMDLYKLAESGKLTLDDTVMITKEDISTDADYGNYANLQPGTTISLREAAKIALQHSDNTAINIVKRAVQPLVSTDTDSFESLDVTYSYGTDNNTAVPKDSKDKNVLISARSYSSILKCLYYACFLQPQDSQEILNNLVDSAGGDRIAAGIGKNIKFAHKIGSSLKADSDCGIVYYPQKPYLICLFFFWDKSANLPSNTDTDFKKVSQMVYDYIAKSGND